MKTIQEQWRIKVRLDFGRKKLLQMKWDERRLLLIKQHHNKPKKAFLLRKLRSLTEDVRDTAIAVYYNEAKAKYLKALVEWFRKREQIGAVLKLNDQDRSSARRLP